jgi:hypothetical protein
MALLLILFVYLPILAVNPFDINDGLNFFVSTLAFGGAALLLAKAMPGDGRINVFEDSRAHPAAPTL